MYSPRLIDSAAAAPCLAYCPFHPKDNNPLHPLGVSDGQSLRQHLRVEHGLSDDEANAWLNFSTTLQRRFMEHSVIRATDLEASNAFRLMNNDVQKASFADFLIANGHVIMGLGENITRHMFNKYGFVSRFGVPDPPTGQNTSRPVTPVLDGSLSASRTRHVSPSRAGQTALEELRKRLVCELAGARPTTSAVPPAISNVPPPNFWVPPSNFSVPPPNFSVPPPNFGDASATSEVPPATVRAATGQSIAAAAQHNAVQESPSEDSLFSGLGDVLNPDVNRRPVTAKAPKAERPTKTSTPREDQ
ncbi:hypothetical protein AAVH_41676, partial [Aphelenchoides avenae]